MRMISLMNSISKIASIIDNEMLAGLRNKVLHKAATIQKLTEVEFLNNLVDYGNKHYLNFSKLEMDVNDDIETLGGH